MVHPLMVDLSMVHRRMVPPFIADPFMVHPSMVDRRMVPQFIVDPSMVDPCMVDRTVAPHMVDRRMVHPSIVDPSMVEHLTKHPASVGHAFGVPSTDQDRKRLRYAAQLLWVPY